ncbi:MAG TPA: phosphoglycerate mutase family protein [Acidimicrobiia bacterium]|nr:phosphoglycerate mutase family protein [Acidimicrobiia bacterium]
MIFLLRHAKAGDRSQWSGDDRLRPLSRAGHAQAFALVDQLASTPFERIVSSPYVRCMETVVPLAGARGVAIEPSDALAEGAPLHEALALMGKHMEHGAVLCTHGDIVPMVLSHLAANGVAVDPDPRWPKGSTWVLETTGADIVAARYLPPPVE